MDRRFLQSRLLSAGVAVSVLCGAAPASGADVTAAEAATLETQVRDWLGGLMGAGVKLSDRPVAITAAGDHFDVSAPLNIPGGIGPLSLKGGTPIVMLGAARPLEGGRWSVDGVHVQSPVAFTVDMPIPPPPAPAGKPGAPSAATPQPAMATTPVHYTIALTGQDGRILWDPSFATPSTWTSAAQSVTSHAEGGPVSQDSSFGPFTSQGTLRPAGPDRVDVLTEGTMLNYKAGIGRGPGSAGGTTDVAMQRIQATVAMNGVSRARAVTVLQALASGGNPPAGAAPRLPPAAVRAVLDALQDIASDFSMHETAEGVSMTVADNRFLLDAMTLGFGAKSDKGLLAIDLDLGMTGLSLPDLPLGGLEALIPHKVALRPVVSGVSVAELMAMARQSSEGRTPTQADFAAMLSHGGIDAGLQSMTIEIGGAVITGHGTALMTDRQQVTGDAVIVAENFDALMQKVNSIPAAAQAAAVLIMAKGMGRTEGNRTVWDVAYHDGRLLVNAVDLAAMVGGGGQRPAPGRTPPRPAR